MITISLCMIVKNEEKVIGRCLDSIKNLVDEIIIVDTGSTDSTKEIIKAYTDKVYDFEWVDNFSVARNFSFSKATKDYILWLDADDVILEEDRIKLMKLKATLDTSVDMVMMRYNAGFDEFGAVTLSYYRERLSKRNNNYRWNEPVHEHLDIWGNIINSDICITHIKETPLTPGRNLNIYRDNISKGNELSPRGIYYYARELYNHQLYDEAIKYFNRFLSLEEGWAEDKIACCFNLAMCYIYKEDYSSMLLTLIKSFQYDTPRAEICCQIGYYYFYKEDLKKAIVWYKLARELEKPADSWGFILHDYWGYIPNLQLCVCYDRLGDLEKANYCNEKAAEKKPKDPAIAHNRAYFKTKGYY